MDSSVSRKDEIWFLRVCHHISTGFYNSMCSETLVASLNDCRQPRGLRCRYAVTGMLGLGLEFRRGHECLSVVTVVCFKAEVCATGRSLIQRSPTDYGVSDYDRETSTMRRLWPTRGCCTVKNVIPVYRDYILTV